MAPWSGVGGQPAESEVVLFPETGDVGRTDQGCGGGRILSLKHAKAEMPMSV